MTEFMSLAAQLTPYLALTASSMGQAVLDSAQTRVADSAVEQGRGFLMRALGRERGGEAGGAEEGPGEGDAVEAGEGAADAEFAGLVSRLEPADRTALETAIGHWLLDPGGGLSQESLLGHIRHTAELTRPGTFTNTAHATGPGAIAIGQVTGDVHGGYRAGDQGEGDGR
ncbi:hypothetical protein ACFXAZ_06420 [Streptomyces sp. NPDC059477]|uniref:hypothetical protein n=1 Tax=Streptomyces sp. NPDC059477 TaxID=3346847 RepID=UPI00367BA62F